ncbi:hypothetical protein RF657_16560 [Yersinia rochesterensis]|uniref:hypothetical protein n=1 Tax=Yersinia rochesterensis TaxID=1604335 RepID=UPI0028533B71|nr:hypothetical protein [Yersinia rochesterensis]MDR5019992.1 hypothetical protein [Yersinia rochesterensis]
MINFSNFAGNKVKEDPVVGISIIEMFKKEGLQAYGTIIDQGKYVVCHSHTFLFLFHLFLLCHVLFI